MRPDSLLGEPGCVVVPRPAACLSPGWQWAGSWDQGKPAAAPGSQVTCSSTLGSAFPAVLAAIPEGPCGGGPLHPHCQEREIPGQSQTGHPWGLCGRGWGEGGRVLGRQNWQQKGLLAPLVAVSSLRHLSPPYSSLPQRRALSLGAIPACVSWLPLGAPCPLVWN